MEILDILPVSSVYDSIDSILCNWNDQRQGRL
jgi:hypothetical protein